MTTAADVLNTVLDRLDQSRTDPIFWSRAELLTYLNDGFLEFTLIAGQMVSEATFPLVGAKIQAVPVGSLALIHVAYAEVVIEKSSLENFDRQNPNWEAQSGILRQWAPCGLDKWIVDRHPVLATNVSLTTLNAPAVLTETSTIDLAPEFIEALTDYVFHMARFKEGGAEFGQAMTQYDSFQNKAGLRQQKTWSEQFVLWGRDPNADTGGGYSTLNRS